MEDQVIVPTSEAIDRVVEMLRKRLEDARANGQRIRMSARETGQTRMLAKDISRMSLSDIVKSAKASGFEFHLYVEQKKWGIIYLAPVTKRT